MGAQFQIGFRSRRTLVALLASVSLLSCRPDDPPLRVGIPPWAPAGLAVVARDLGSFGDGDVDLVQYSSPIELARHFREGSLDVAALTLDSLPYFTASIATLDVVLVTGISQGADGLVTEPEYTDVTALRGKRIGVESSPLAAHMLLRALHASGLPLRSIEPVLLDSEEQAELFLAHRLDALVTREPDRSRLVSAGARSLFDSSQSPGQVVDVLVVPHDVLAARPDVLRKLVGAWLAAADRLKDERAATIAKLAAVMSIDAATAERALAGWRLGDLAMNRELLGGSPPRLAATLDGIEKLAAEAGLLRSDRRGTVRFDASLLPPVVGGGAAR